MSWPGIEPGPVENAHDSVNHRSFALLLGPARKLQSGSAQDDLANTEGRIQTGGATAS
jgi:hypothetical protein